MDNFFQGCPAKMSDGRIFTDYRPHTQMEEQIKFVNGLTRDDEARMFLQRNAETIMNKEWDYNKSSNSCWKSECIHKYGTYISPQEMVEQMNNYNKLGERLRAPFTCPTVKDYRMTESNKK